MEKTGLPSKTKQQERWQVRCADTRAAFRELQRQGR